MCRPVPGQPYCYLLWSNKAARERYGAPMTQEQRIQLVDHLPPPVLNVCKIVMQGIHDHVVVSCCQSQPFVTESLLSQRATIVTALWLSRATAPHGMRDRHGRHENMTHWTNCTSPRSCTQCHPVLVMTSLDAANAAVTTITTIFKLCCGRMNGQIVQLLHA